MLFSCPRFLLEDFKASDIQNLRKIDLKINWFVKTPFLYANPPGSANSL